MTRAFDLSDDVAQFGDDASGLSLGGAEVLLVDGVREVLDFDLGGFGLGAEALALLVGPAGGEFGTWGLARAFLTNLNLVVPPTTYPD